MAIPFPTGSEAPARGHGDPAILQHELARGLEAPIARLRQVDARRRLLELALFPGLFVLGVAVGGLAYVHLEGPVELLVRAIAVVAAVVGLNAMVLLLHEGLHGTLWPNPRVNRLLAVACGVPLLMSFSAYRVMHLRHHRYLGDPRDPDDYHNYTSSRRLIWALHYTRLAFGSFLYLFLIPFLAWRNGTARERRDVVVEYLGIAAVFAAIASLVPAAVLVRAWLVPAVLTGWLVNLRGFCQHGLADARDPFLASRSILTHRWLAFALLHENLHLEHHLFPDVPSHHLAELRGLIVARYPRQNVTRSYSEVLGQCLLQSLRLDERWVGQVEASAPGGAERC